VRSRRHVSPRPSPPLLRQKRGDLSAPVPKHRNRATYRRPVLGVKQPKKVIYVLKLISLTQRSFTVIAVEPEDTCTVILSIFLTSAAVRESPEGDAL
jgi:hypothetical protein